MFVFYWLIAIMPLDEHPLWGRELFWVFTPVKVIGVLCIFVAVYRIWSHHQVPRLFYSPQAKWYVALFVVQCSSYFVQGGKVHGTAYSHVATIAALFFVVPVLVDSLAKLNRTLLAAIGALGFSSLYALRQWQNYGDVASYRASGMFNDSNEYALITGLWIPLAFLWVAGKRPLWERLFCGICLGCMVFGVAVAGSRGGFLGLVSGLGLLVMRSHKRLLYLGALAGVMIPLLFLAPNSAWRRLRNPTYGDEQATESRLVTWKAGLRMIQAHPLTGVGIDNFKPLVAHYEDPGELVIKLAHNTYIEMAAELGVGGLLAFVGTFVAVLYSLEVSRRRALRMKAFHLAATASGLQAGVVQYMIGAIFLTAWWEKMVWVLVFLSMVMYRITAVRMMRHMPSYRRANGNSEHMDDFGTEAAEEGAEVEERRPGVRYVCSGAGRLRYWGETQ